MKNADEHERISAVDDPACWFKAAYRESVPAKSIFIHPEDYRTVGKAALVALKPNRGHAGGFPACRARGNVTPFRCL